MVNREDIEKKRPKGKRLLQSRQKPRKKRGTKVGQKDSNLRFFGIEESTQANKNTPEKRHTLTLKRKKQNKEQKSTQQKQERAHELGKKQSRRKCKKQEKVRDTKIAPSSQKIFQE